MVFRSATQADMPQVNILRADVACMHAAARPDIFCDVPAAARMPSMEYTGAEMLADAGKDVIICEDNGVIAAFACVDFVERPANAWSPEQRYCYVKEFGVAESYRRQGLGKQLMKYVMEQACMRGIRRIELDVWSFNQKAMQLYESLGFRQRYSYMELDVQ